MVSLRGFVVLLSGLTATGLALPSPPIERGPIVTRRDVTFAGTSNGKLESFLNIRFGEDTSGINRFAAPKAFDYPPGTTVNVSSPGAACPQPKVPLPGFPIFSNVTNMSEDCLNLRIDRPKGTSTKSKLPVMVWIYGGGYSIGQIYDQAYDPTGLIFQSIQNEQPVVYVAMNYRLSFFGFSAFLPSNTSAELNVGLLDQRLALEWIRNNIEAFGGDPENVTIFGESDGATSVGLQLTAYAGTQPAPFKRAIMQSGSPLSDTGIASNISFQYTNQLSTIIDCPIDDASAQIDCLRSLPLDMLLPANLNFTMTINPFAGIDVFIPSASNDSSFLPSAPSTLLQHGRFARDVPIIVGWNEDDSSIFVPSAEDFKSNEVTLTSWFKQAFPGVTDTLMSQALSLYRTDTVPIPQQAARYPSLPVDWFQASLMARDTNTVCRALLLASTTAEHKMDTNSYLYVLNSTLFAPFLAAQNLSYEGVTHFSDIPYVFNQAVVYNASQAEVRLAEKISSTWIAFANGLGVDTYTGIWPSAPNQQDEFPIKVLGTGTNATVEASRDGTDFENIFERCSFWNSEVMLEALQV